MPETSDGVRLMTPNTLLLVPLCSPTVVVRVPSSIRFTTASLAGAFQFTFTVPALAVSTAAVRCVAGRMSSRSKMLNDWSLSALKLVL